MNCGLQVRAVSCELDRGIVSFELIGSCELELQVVSCELRVASCEVELRLRVGSWELRVTGWE